MQVPGQSGFGVVVVGAGVVVVVVVVVVVGVVGTALVGLWPPGGGRRWLEGGGRRRFGGLGLELGGRSSEDMKKEARDWIA
jgi:hypothetical protein